MATPIANPVIVLGLDSSQLLKGLSGAVSTASLLGKKIGETLAATISAPMNALKIGTQISAPLNQAMELMGKAQRILGAPFRALMQREQDQANNANQPIMNATSTTMTAVMARFVNEIEELAADLVVGLDRAFNFRAILEGFRGVASGVRSLLVAAFGPLIAVANDKQALDAAFAQGQQIAVDGFKMVAEAVIDVSANVIKLANAVLSFLNSVKNFMPFNKETEDKIAQWQKDNARVVNVPGVGMGGRGGINPNAVMGQQVIPGDRAAAIKALGLDQQMAMIPELNVQAAKQGIANIVGRFKPAAFEPLNMAENDLKAFVSTLGDARSPLQDMVQNMRQFQAHFDAMNAAVQAMPPGAAQNAAFDRLAVLQNQGDLLLSQRLQSILSPTLQQMQSGQITSAAQAGSAALVEAVVRASAQSEAGDIQHQIKTAIDLQLAQQQAQTKIQKQILDAARAGGLVGVGKL